MWVINLSLSHSIANSAGFFVVLHRCSVSCLCMSGQSEYNKGRGLADETMLTIKVEVSSRLALVNLQSIALPKLRVTLSWVDENFACNSLANNLACQRMSKKPRLRIQFRKIVLIISLSVTTSLRCTSSRHSALISKPTNFRSQL
jgi:hypothetical protein